MLESGARRLTPKLARRLMRVYGLSPTVLKPSGQVLLRPLDPQSFAEDLGELGYPGYAYLGAKRWKRNPCELLLLGLSQQDLEARLVEALPWLLMRYWDVDTRWLVDQSKLRDLQNRLGFVVGLARQAADARNPDHGSRACVLEDLERALEASKLVREDTLCQRTLTKYEREWLYQNRTELAKHWNLLTDWRAEYLRYVA